MVLSPHPHVKVPRTEWGAHQGIIAPSSIRQRAKCPRRKCHFVVTKLYGFADFPPRFNGLSSCVEDIYGEKEQLECVCGGGSCLRADNRIAGLKHFSIVSFFFCILGYNRGGLEVLHRILFSSERNLVRFHIVLFLLVTGDLDSPGGP